MSEKGKVAARWYIIACDDDGLDETIEAMKALGFYHSKEYGKWGLSGTDRVLICGLIPDDKLEEIRLLPRVHHIKPEEDVDPFLQHFVRE